ncbi:MAG: uroporphyrinogen-III C-methyltransferase [Alphaproteobacteria bacterium]|nr:uroporphyrinogen-III C-methyltransferase [Alphaproteobacteria bacterium]
MTSGCHAAGIVHLVGAGPGDPDLLTVRARRLIERAEAVVYDRLVAPEILALAPAGALHLDVGKLPGLHRVPQPEINALLVDLARRGLEVVRLKGGDPYIFGRGSEEAEHLHANGIAFDVVPGITSAAGCATAIGVPLTHRGMATGVRYVTGHCQGDAPLDLDWRGLADPATTLVIYMGLAQIARIAAALIEAGLPATMPFAAVQSGTTPRQRHRIGTLAEAGGIAASFEDRGPVLFIVGHVVALADSLAPPRAGAAAGEDRHAVPALA